MSPHTHEPAHDVSSPVGGFDRFQAIIDADDRPVCAFDPDLRYTAFNRAHAAVMRDLYGADIAIGGCLKDYLTVDADREAISAHLERAFAGERVVTGATSGDPGGLRFFDIVHTPLTDADGTVSGVVVRAREIVTPQDSPALHATFFETALEGFAYCRMLYDDHGRPDDFVCLAVNPAFERVTGLKGVVGKRITAVLPTVRDEMPDIFATHARVSETGEPAEFEIDFKPLGVWLLVSVTRPEPGHFAARFTDITERKAMEKALREMQATHDVAESVAHVGSVRFDLTTQHATWSPETYRLFDIDPAEFDGSAATIFETRIHPDDRASQEEALPAVLATGRSHPTDFRVVWRDGTVRILHGEGTAEYDADGRPLSITGYYQDVTEQRQAEAAMRASEARYRSIFESSHEGIALLGRGGRVFAWNEAVARITGVDAETVAAEPGGAHDWGAIHEDGTPWPPSDYPSMRTLATGRPCSDVVLGFRRDDGTHWVTVNTRPVFTEGDDQPVAVVMAVLDITKRREIERALLRSKAMRDVAERVGRTGSYRWEAATRKATWSQGMRALFDIDQDDFDGDMDPVFQSRVHPGDLARVRESEAALAASGEITALEFRVIHRDGSEHILHMEPSAEFDDAGTMTAVTGYCQDVTGQRTAEAEIGRLNAELQARLVSRTEQLDATAKELEALAYSISHDVRAPLRAIDGFSATVLQDEAGHLSERAVDDLQRVRRAAQRLGELMDDLLGLSKLARRDLLRRPVDVSATARAVGYELTVESPDRRVELVVQADLTANADQAMVRLILRELLDNAWKFTGRHHQARVEVGALDVDGERAFFVRDDGAGFDPRRAEHLFGIFQRVHTASQFEGDGVGLAMVQRLVRRHGGRVWAVAEVERGATVFFTLPPPP